MSHVEPPLPGWCALCKRAVEGDMARHMEQDHPISARKIRTAKMSWQDRLENIIESLGKIPTEADHDAQIDRIDESLQELYLVRSKIAHLRGGRPIMRVREGTVIMEET